MGRIKTVAVKRVTKELLRRFPDEFTEDFTKNKEVLARHTEIPSIKVRNVVAGYASRLVKAKNAGGKEARKVTPEDMSKYYG